MSESFSKLQEVNDKKVQNIKHLKENMKDQKDKPEDKDKEYEKLNNVYKKLECDKDLVNFFKLY